MSGVKHATILSTILKKRVLCSLVSDFFSHKNIIFFIKVISKYHKTKNKIFLSLNINIQLLNDASVCRNKIKQSDLLDALFIFKLSSVKFTKKIHTNTVNIEHIGHLLLPIYKKSSYSSSLSVSLC